MKTPAEKKTERPGIADAFEKITGIVPPTNFGEPFKTAFSRLYNGEEDEIAAAAYTCALFLSAILEKYPTERLHTFVHYIQENYNRFAFNCNMYDTIFKNMDFEKLKSVCLLKSNNDTILRECKKEDIFEAFDFYTNR
ncbi:MAG: hypothetical protein IKY19_08175 [Bacteroidaceae bacterium]|nr:hypothetical protein [Bacteroidaceae bacterium]